jgi:hypothetical protein
MNEYKRECPEEDKMRGLHFIGVLIMAFVVAYSLPGAAQECSPAFVVYGYLYHATPHVPVNGGYTIVVRNHTKDTFRSVPVGTGFDRGTFCAVFLLDFEPCVVDLGDNISVSVDSLSLAPPAPGGRDYLAGPVYHIVTSDDIHAMKVQMDATLPLPVVAVQGRTWGAIKSLFR